MRKLLFIILLIGVLFLSGCSESSDSIMREKQEQLMQEVDKQVGMPAIVNFQERKLAKMIFELRDKENLKTYTYIKSDYNGKLNFFCDSIGYGLPYSVQYTNPMKRLYKNATIPQADPNGLFMPEGLSATWVMCIDPKTQESRPVYVEPEIVVSPFKL